MTGPVRPELADMKDLQGRELWAVAPLIALIIALGVYPKPVLDIINPAVNSTLVQVHSPDPVPPHPAAASASTSTSSDLHHAVLGARPAPHQLAQSRGARVTLKQRSSA